MSSSERFADTISYIGELYGLLSESSSIFVILILKCPYCNLKFILVRAANTLFESEGFGMEVGRDLADLWRVAEPDIWLPDDEVHVWRESLKQPPSLVRALSSALSEDEQERAGRFYFQRDREHFIVARAMLRIILGRYLNMEPGQLSFCYSSYGKPYLAQENNREDLRFNLSHSGELALIAVTRGREIGVDIELIRQDVLEEKIADRFFSQLEAAMLRALPIDLQAEAFFNCWTRKEAYIKARGEGLSLPLDKFDVSLAPGEPAALLGIRIGSEEMSRWNMLELAVGAGYAAALVIEGRDRQLKCWQRPPMS